MTPLEMNHFSVVTEDSITFIENILIIKNYIPGDLYHCRADAFTEQS